MDNSLKTLTTEVMNDKSVEGCLVIGRQGLCIDAKGKRSSFRTDKVDFRNILIFQESLIRSLLASWWPYQTRQLNWSQIHIRLLLFWSLPISKDNVQGLLADLPDRLLSSTCSSYFIQKYGITVAVLKKNTPTTV